jgi:outer membrane lipoprotein LolB
MMRFLALILTISLLMACTEVPTKSDEHYKVSERAYLYQLKQWSFEGRLSLTDGRESWSAAIVWAHTEGKDEIKLSGPLGQGAALITLTNDSVTIDRGDDKPRQSKQVDEFIQQQLGVFVPVRALRYWVLGLTQPERPFFEVGDGFEQEKWNVHYLQMQNLGKDWLPRKIGIEHGEAKLKLFINQWTM